MRQPFACGRGKAGPDCVSSAWTLRSGLCAAADERAVSAATSLAGLLAAAVASCLEQGPEIWSIASATSIAGLDFVPGNCYRREQTPCTQPFAPSASEGVTLCACVHPMSSFSCADQHQAADAVLIAMQGIVESFGDMLPAERILQMSQFLEPLREDTKQLYNRVLHG